MRGVVTREGVAVRQRAGDVLALPGVELRLTAELALRAAIDSHVFAALRDLESLDGGRAVQAVYVALLRRLPNVRPDRKRIAIDSGVSESSVKRAIKLLEASRLIEVERARGRCSVYHVADLRQDELASESLSAIRKLARSGKPRPGRATSEPTRKSPRVISEPTSGVLSEPGVGSQANQKDPSKNQTKQQGVACGLKKGRELEETLARWGLESASYLACPGHEKAIPLLVENLERAPELIEEAMKSGSWSAESGVGAKVVYLREHMRDAIRNIEDRERRAADRDRDARVKASEVVAELPNVEIDLSGITKKRYESLLRRGLERLDEDAAVIRHVVRDGESRMKLVSVEVLRDEVLKRVDEMPAAKFDLVVAELLYEQPRLCKLYGDAAGKSKAVRLCAIEYLVEKAIRESEAKAESNRSIALSEVVSSPRTQPLDTQGGRVAYKDRQRRNLLSVRASALRRLSTCGNENRTQSLRGA